MIFVSYWSAKDCCNGGIGVHQKAYQIADERRQHRQTEDSSTRGPKQKFLSTNSCFEIDAGCRVGEFHLSN